MGRPEGLHRDTCKKIRQVTRNPSAGQKQTGVYNGKGTLGGGGTVEFVMAVRCLGFEFGGAAIRTSSRRTGGGGEVVEKKDLERGAEKSLLCGRCSMHPETLDYFLLALGES